MKKIEEQDISVSLPQTEEEKELVKRYVKPHDKLSRDITDEDLLRVAEEAKIMFELCWTPVGLYPGGEAVAHSQIDDKDPLKLFVTKNKEIIINANIVNHTKTTVPRAEGCLTFPDMPFVTVERWNKVTVEYQTITPDGKLSDKITENMNGHRANIFQHEIMCHFLNQYIYPFNK